MTDHDHSLCVLADGLEAFCLQTGKPGPCVGQKRGQHQIAAPTPYQARLRQVRQAPQRDTDADASRAKTIADGDALARRAQLLQHTGGLKGKQTAGVSAVQQATRKVTRTAQQAQRQADTATERGQRQHDADVKANERAQGTAERINTRRQEAHRKRQEAADVRDAAAARKPKAAKGGKGGKSSGPVSVARWLKYGIDGTDTVDFWLAEFATGKKAGTCKYCTAPAAKGVRWAEGMARIPVCDEHVAKAKAVVRREEGPGGVVGIDTVAPDGTWHSHRAYTLEVDDTYEPVLDLDGATFALYGLDLADPYAGDPYGMADPLHLDCGIGEFCRNPLHPGPCKGWKHMLHSVSPAAYHAMEKARVEKLNANRKAKIAALEAAGKKVPSYLKKPVTYKQTPEAPPGSSYKAPTPEQAKAALPPTMAEIEKNLTGKHAAKSAAVTANPKASTKQKVNQHLLLADDGFDKLPTATKGKILDDLADAEHDPSIPADTKKAAADKLHKLSDVAAGGGNAGKLVSHVKKTTAAKKAGQPLPKLPPGYLSDNDGDGDGKIYDGTPWERKPSKGGTVNAPSTTKAAPAGDDDDAPKVPAHQASKVAALKAKLAAHQLLTKAEFDALPKAEQDQVIADLHLGSGHPYLPESTKKAALATHLKLKKGTTPSPATDTAPAGDKPKAHKDVENLVNIGPEGIAAIPPLTQAKALKILAAAEHNPDLPESLKTAAAKTLDQVAEQLTGGKAKIAAHKIAAKMDADKKADLDAKGLYSGDPAEAGTHPILKAKIAGMSLFTSNNVAGLPKEARDSAPTSATNINFGKIDGDDVIDADGKTIGKLADKADAGKSGWISVQTSVRNDGDNGYRVVGVWKPADAPAAPGADEPKAYDDDYLTNTMRVVNSTSASPKRKLEAFNKAMTKSKFDQLTPRDQDRAVAAAKAIADGNDIMDAAQGQMLLDAWSGKQQHYALAQKKSIVALIFPQSDAANTAAHAYLTKAEFAAMPKAYRAAVLKQLQDAILKGDPNASSVRNKLIDAPTATAPAVGAASYNPGAAQAIDVVNGTGTPLQKLDKIKGLLKLADYQALTPVDKGKVDALLAKGKVNGSLKTRVLATFLSEGWNGNLKGLSTDQRFAIRAATGDGTPAVRLQRYSYLSKEEFDALHPTFRLAIKTDLEKLSKNWPPAKGILKKFYPPADAPAPAEALPPSARYNSKQLTAVGMAGSAGTSPYARMSAYGQLSKAEFDALAPEHKALIEADLANIANGPLPTASVVAKGHGEKFGLPFARPNAPAPGASTGTATNATKSAIDVIKSNPIAKGTIFAHLNNVSKADFDALDPAEQDTIADYLYDIKTGGDPDFLKNWAKTLFDKFKPLDSGAHTTPAPAAPTPAVSAPAGPVGKLTKVPGGIGSNHGAYKATDEAGNVWVVKPKESGKSMIGPAEAAVSQLSNKVGVATPTVTLRPDGSTVQPWVKGSTEAFPTGFDPKKLSAADILAVQKHHALDWLTGQHDAHYRNWLRDADGNLVEIDKGQAFKYYATDKLDSGYHPNGAYGEKPPIYNALVTAAAKGDVQLYSPGSGEFGAFLKSVADLPDAEVRAMFRPYAQAVKAEGGALPGGSVDLFLAKVVARKNDLGSSFAEFYAKEGVFAYAPDAKVVLPDVPAEAATKGHAEHSASPFHILKDSGKSGDGYYTNPDGSKGPWGLYGSAGVLIKAPGPDGEPRFLMVQRGPGVTSNKGKWQLPGGGLDSNENAHQGAARETYEELGVSEAYLAKLKPHGDHVYETAGGWKYTSIAAEHERMFDPKVDGTETGAAKWFTAAELAQLDADGKLHPNLAKGALEKNVLALYPGDAPAGVEHPAPAVSAPAGGTHPALIALDNAPRSAHGKYNAVKDLTKEEFDALHPTFKAKVVSALQSIGKGSAFYPKAETKLIELGTPAAGKSLADKADTMAYLAAEIGLPVASINAAKEKFLNWGASVGKPTDEPKLATAAGMFADQHVKKMIEGKGLNLSEQETLTDAVTAEIKNAFDTGDLPGEGSIYEQIKGASAQKLADLAHPSPHLTTALAALYNEGHALDLAEAWNKVGKGEFDALPEASKAKLQSALVKGHKALLTGIAKGAVNDVHVYLFGHNIPADPVPVDQSPHAPHVQAVLNGVQDKSGMFTPGMKLALIANNTVTKADFNKMSTAEKAAMGKALVDAHDAGFGPQAEELQGKYGLPKGGTPHIDPLNAPPPVDLHEWANPPAPLNFDAPHVKDAIAYAGGNGSKKPTAKLHLEVYDKLTPEEFQALTPDQQAAIKKHLQEAKEKFLAPAKIAQAQAVLDKLTGPVSHVSTPAPAAPAPGTVAEVHAKHANAAWQIAQAIDGDVAIKGLDTMKGLVLSYGDPGEHDYGHLFSSVGQLISFKVLSQSLKKAGLSKDDIGDAMHAQFIDHLTAEVGAAIEAGKPGDATVLYKLDAFAEKVAEQAKKVSEENGIAADGDALTAWKVATFTAGVQGLIDKEGGATPPSVTAPAGAGGASTAPNVAPIAYVTPHTGAYTQDMTDAVVTFYSGEKEMVKIAALDKLDAAQLAGLKADEQEQIFARLEKIFAETKNDEKREMARGVLIKFHPVKLAKLDIAPEQYSALPDGEQAAHLAGLEQLAKSPAEQVAARAKQLVSKFQMAKLAPYEAMTKQQFLAKPDAWQDEHLKILEKAAQSSDVAAAAKASQLYGQFQDPNKIEYFGLKFNKGATVQPQQGFWGKDNYGNWTTKAVVLTGQEEAYAKYLEKLNAAVSGQAAHDVPTHHLKKMQAKVDGNTDKAYGNLSTKTVAAAIYSYSKSSTDINAMMRKLKGKLPDPKKYDTTDEKTSAKEILAIDKAMEKSRTTEDLVMMRGFNSRYYENGSTKNIFQDSWSTTHSLVDAEWIDPAFGSTSTQHGTARNFSGSGDTSIVMRLFVPKGTPMVALDTASNYQGESEILLGRNTKYRVVADHGYQNGKRMLDVEVVPQ